MDWGEIYGRLRRDRNDASAWEALAGRVRRWARAEVGSRGWHVVEDLVADTCAGVFMRFDNARGAETFSGFVGGRFRAALKEVLEPIRRPVGSIDDSLVRLLSDDGTTMAETVVDAVYKSEVLIPCLRALPDRERRAVELRYFHEATIEEIARELGVTLVNARQILFVARSHLRQCVERRGACG